jgi:hypothetical protein
VDGARIGVHILAWETNGIFVDRLKSESRSGFFDRCDPGRLFLFWPWECVGAGEVRSGGVGLRGTVSPSPPPDGEVTDGSGTEQTRANRCSACLILGNNRILDQCRSIKSYLPMGSGGAG